jgi:hypothetical protein
MTDWEERDDATTTIDDVVTTNQRLDAIFERIKRAGLSYGGAPWSLDDGKLNDWKGGRGVYFKTRTVTCLS